MEVLCFLPITHYSLYNFDLRATHARTLLRAALESVSFGFVLVRVRVRVIIEDGLIRHTCPGNNGSDGSGPKWHAYSTSVLFFWVKLSRLGRVGKDGRLPSLPWSCKRALSPSQT